MFNQEMQYRKVGHSGLKVSALSLGGWTTFGGSVKDWNLIQSIHRKAYEAGINFFDNADIYAKGESEKVVGEAIKDFPRHELVLSSKVYWPMSEDVNDQGLSRKHIFESVNKSLKRMQVDYFDLYFCHRYDLNTPLEETARAMSDLVQAGKVLYWGTSEWTAGQIQNVIKVCKENGWHAPIVEQPQYNLLERKIFEKEVGPTCTDLGLGTVTWSPLASGLLTGKYVNGAKEGRLAKISWLAENLMTSANLEKMKSYVEICKKQNLQPSQLALAWCLRHSAVSSVITGASRLEQLEENLGALKIEINPDVEKALDQIFK